MNGDDSQLPGSPSVGRPPRQKERAPRIPDDIWENFKGIIRSKWIDEDLTQDDVLEYLENDPGFRPRQGYHTRAFPPLLSPKQLRCDMANRSCMAVIVLSNLGIN